MLTVFPPMLRCRGVSFARLLRRITAGRYASAMSALLPREGHAPPPPKSRVSKAAPAACLYQFENLATDARFFSPWTTVPPMPKKSLRSENRVFEFQAKSHQDNPKMYDNWTDSTSRWPPTRKFFERKINPFGRVCQLYISGIVISFVVLRSQR